MTGAPLPEGADAVVMQEKTRLPSPGAQEVEILEPVGPRHFVRDRGEDAKAGEVLLPRGAPIGIPEAGLLWAQGLTHVPTFRAPRVAILSTGDELCRVEEAADDLIVDTNGPSLAAAVRRAGGEPTLLGIARDTLEDVLAKLEPALGYDIVLTSAGVSVGEKDFVKEALARLGVAMDFWRVAIKPGKPLAVGRRGDTVFFGLPGNPTSSLVSFELFVRPALRRWLGHADVEPPRVPGRLEVPLKKPAGLTHYVRVVASWREGQLWARPLASQTSGALRSAASATHLMEFPKDTTALSPGDQVALLPPGWRA
jgi:molybdopterin molybdotransferase